jgi:hypothetical protein
LARLALCVRPGKRTTPLARPVPLQEQVNKVDRDCAGIPAIPLVLMILKRDRITNTVWVRARHMPPGGFHTSELPFFIIRVISFTLVQDWTRYINVPLRLLATFYTVHCRSDCVIECVILNPLWGFNTKRFAYIYHCLLSPTRCKSYLSDCHRCINT